jgi:acetylornithine deacetylase/succinyl-diaminopimelate desuccinylase-like protein
VAARTPPEITWGAGASHPPRRAEGEPIVQALLGAGRDLGTRSPRRPDNCTTRNAHRRGRDPGRVRPGDVHRAHTADEYVPVDELVACAQRIALAAMRFCTG